MKRIFVVGAPRSGTTLLQATISQCFGCYSMRETHFYQSVIHQRMSWLTYLYVNHRRIRRALIRIIKENDLPSHLDMVGWYNNRNTAGRSLVNIFDFMAEASNLTAWVEKSPEHVFWVSEIQKSVDNVKFIHTIRPVQDIVASMVDAGQKYGGVWARLCNIDVAINEAAKYIMASYACCALENHYYVSYDQLVDDRCGSSLKALSRFLGRELITGDRVDSSNQKIVRKDEYWKTEQSPKKGSLTKFDKLFSKSEQEHIYTYGKELNARMTEVLDSQLRDGL